jgi:hypothetical protein
MRHHTRVEHANNYITDAVCIINISVVLIKPTAQLMLNINIYYYQVLSIVLTSSLLVTSISHRDTNSKDKYQKGKPVRNVPKTYIHFVYTCINISFAIHLSLIVGTVYLCWNSYNASTLFSQSTQKVFDFKGPWPSSTTARITAHGRSRFPYSYYNLTMPYLKGILYLPPLDTLSNQHYPAKK